MAVGFVCDDECKQKKNENEKVLGHHASAILEVIITSEL